MDGCALVSAGQSGPRHIMAPAACQAGCSRGLPPAHWQRVSTVSCLSPPWMRMAIFSHVMLTCPVFQAVWQRFVSMWTAINRMPPPLHPDILLADDRRVRGSH